MVAASVLLFYCAADAASAAGAVTVAAVGCLKVVGGGGSCPYNDNDNGSLLCVCVCGYATVHNHNKRYLCYTEERVGTVGRVYCRFGLVSPFTYGPKCLYI